MTTDLATALTVSNPTDRLKAVRQALIRLSLAQTPTDLSEDQKGAVRSALLWLNEMSEYQTIGICSESIAEAEPALKGYVAALSAPINVDLPTEQTGAVFLKFNTLKNAWYLDGYSGESRGVLVTYHTTEAGMDDVNGTYGPFPLDLF